MLYGLLYWSHNRLLITPFKHLITYDSHHIKHHFKLIPFFKIIHVQFVIRRIHQHLDHRDHEVDRNDFGKTGEELG